MNHDALFDLTPETAQAQDRTRSRARLQALAASPDLRVVALATTGLRSAAPVAAAVVGPHGAVLLNTLVHTDQVIEADAQAIHGVRQADLHGAPSLRTVMEQLEALTGPGRDVVLFAPGWTIGMLSGACGRAGVETFNMSHWESGQDLLAPLCGTYNWNKGKWSPLKFVDAIRDLAMPGDFAALGTALGNAQRLHALIVHYAHDPAAAPLDEAPVHEASCGRCGAPESFCECPAVGVTA